VVTTSYEIAHMNATTTSLARCVDKGNRAHIEAALGKVRDLLGEVRAQRPMSFFWGSWGSWIHKFTWHWGCWVAFDNFEARP